MNQEMHSLEYLPGFREMMEEQSVEKIGAMAEDKPSFAVKEKEVLPPERLRMDEEYYWKEYEYMLQLLPMNVREIWAIAEALLDEYEYKESPMYMEYPDGETLQRLCDEVCKRAEYQKEMNGEKCHRYLVQSIVYWNISYRRQRYYRIKKIFPDAGIKK